MKKTRPSYLLHRCRLACKSFGMLLSAVLCVSLISLQALAAPPITVNGKIVDEKDAPLAGASVQEKGTANTILTKVDGSFTINVSSEKATLVISYVGYSQQEVPAKSAKNLTVKLASASQALENVVVVGYGRQKKESVVGAIVQTTGTALQRAGGVSSIGAALTGNVPGVITVQGTGMP